MSHVSYNNVAYAAWIAINPSAKLGLCDELP